MFDSHGFIVILNIDILVNWDLLLIVKLFIIFEFVLFVFVIFINIQLFRSSLRHICGAFI